MSLRSWRSRSSSDPLRDIVVWAILVACLTIVGAIWLTAEHLDYDDFSPAILLIGYSPALASIATVGLLRVLAASEHC